MPRFGSPHTKIHRATIGNSSRLHVSLPTTRPSVPTIDMDTTRKARSIAEVGIRLLSPTEQPCCLDALIQTTEAVHLQSPPHPSRNGSVTSFRSALQPDGRLAVYRLPQRAWPAPHTWGILPTRHSERCYTDPCRLCGLHQKDRRLHVPLEY